MKQVKKKKRQWCNMQKTGSLLGKNTFISWFIVTVFFFFFFSFNLCCPPVGQKENIGSSFKVT